VQADLLWSSGHEESNSKRLDVLTPDHDPKLG